MDMNIKKQECSLYHEGSPEGMWAVLRERQATKKDREPE